MEPNTSVRVCCCILGGGVFLIRLTKDTLILKACVCFYKCNWRTQYDIKLEYVIADISFIKIVFCLKERAAFSFFFIDVKYEFFEFR